MWLSTCQTAFNAISKIKIAFKSSNFIYILRPALIRIVYLKWTRRRSRWQVKIKEELNKLLIQAILEIPGIVERKTWWRKVLRLVDNANLISFLSYMIGNLIGLKRCTQIRNWHLIRWILCYKDRWTLKQINIPSQLILVLNIREYMRAISSKSTMMRTQLINKKLIIKFVTPIYYLIQNILFKRNNSLDWKKMNTMKIVSQYKR